MHQSAGYDDIVKYLPQRFLMKMHKFAFRARLFLIVYPYHLGKGNGRFLHTVLQDGCTLKFTRTTTCLDINCDRTFNILFLWSF